MKRTLFPILLIGSLCSLAYSQVWVQKSPKPPGGSDMGQFSFTIGNKLYIGGGLDRDFYEYDADTKAWTRKADVPGVDTSRTSAIGFSINGKGYAGLGTDGDFVPVLKSDLWEYNPSNDTWTQKADFPKGEWTGAGTFVVNGKAYVGGGGDKNFNYDTFYEYDPSNNSWVQKTALPVGARGNPAMFTINNVGYLMGGQGSIERSDLHKYDPVEDNWIKLADFPGEGRSFAISFALNGNGYVGLGQSLFTEVFRDIYEYNPATDMWKEVDIFPGVGRASAFAGVVNDTAYVGNGFNYGNGLQNDWWQFLPLKSGVDRFLSQKKYSVYPQPAYDVVNFDGLEPASWYSFEVYNALGARILSSKTQSPSVDVSKLIPGIYSVIVTTNLNFFALPIIKN